MRKPVVIGRVVLGAALLVLVAGGAPRRVSAHDFYAAYVQHRLHLSLARDHLDLTVELTFFEEWSERERSAMDTSGDGRIDRGEQRAYLRQLAPQFAQQLQLLQGEKSIPLMELYEPEIDLLGSNRTGPAHHRLRLFYFALTPNDLRPDDELILRDSLWPAAKALATVEAEKGPSAVLEAQKPRDPAWPPLRPGEARAFKIRCVRPLASPPAAKPPASPPLRQGQTAVDGK